jgi:peroxiredoxin
MNFYDSVLDASQDNKKTFIKEFIANNGDKYISPYITYRNTYQFELGELESLFSAFSESVKHSPFVPYIEEHINTMRRVRVGQIYVTFSMRNSEEELVPISSFIGDNYVLLDFWASWCGPCRVENPNLVATYNRFKDKGFEIIGISFDTNKENWLQAVKDDGLTWPQLSDLKGWNNAAGKLYGIRSIPANVLLDKEGYIIAKNLRGQELDEKLEYVFQSNI